MGSKMQETGRTSTTSTLPGFAKDYYNTVSSAAGEAFKQPYDVPLQQIAGFTPDTEQSFQMTRDVAGSGIQGMPYAQALTGGAAGQSAMLGSQLLGGTDPYNVGQYMSPHMQNVVGRQQQEARRQFDIAQAGRDAQAVQAGAFGGSRRGVVDALAQESLARQQGDIAAQGYQSAYENAQQARLNEIEAQRARQQMGLAALGQGAQQAQQLAALGEAQRAADIQGAQLMSGIGATQEARTQAELDAAYQQQLAQQQAPWQQLQNYTGTMGSLYGSIPMNQQSSTSSLQPGVARQALGLGIGALGTLGGAMLGAPAGSLGAGLGQAATGWLGSRLGMTPSASPVARPLMYNLGAQRPIRG